MLSYTGAPRADAHTLDGVEFGMSVVGASRLYAAIAHYAIFGVVPHGRYRRQVTCIVHPTREGSLDQWLSIVPVAIGEYGIRAALYNEAISGIVGWVADGVKQLWTRPSEASQIVDRLAQVMERQSLDNRALAEALAQGIARQADSTDRAIAALDRANERSAQQTDAVARLHERLIETLPILAGATRPAGGQLVQPVGRSCEQLTQFKDRPYASTITEPEAEVIRGGPAMEISDMDAYAVTRIYSVNKLSGHCLVELPGQEGRVQGKITDPTLKVPGDPYTHAMNTHAACRVTAKAVTRSGELHRLFISDIDTDVHEV